MGDENVETEHPIAKAEAFRRLADRHLAASYGLARAILGDAGEAEDATHDAFVTAWRKWGTLRDIARFEHWFDRILVNTCRNRIRRHSRWQVHEIAPEVQVAPDDDIRAADERDALGMALVRLSPDQRVVVALRYYRDLTVDEIAERMGIPSGTVKSRLHNALRSLHGTLDEAAAKEALR